MPTVTDATVVAQAYDTSGNGGRKLVQLNDKSLVAAFKSQTQLFIYRTIDNWNTKTEISASNVLTSTQDIALATDGERIFRLIAFNNNSVSAQSFDKNGISISGTVLDSANQTAIGNVSLAINEAKTELHATWSSKNSTYPNSFNIRYAKGLINVDGTVTWGMVEYLTTGNTTGADWKNPSIGIIDGYPFVVFEQNQPSSSNNRIIFMKNNGSSWSNQSAGYIVTSSYTQSSPSAIFVPQSINGLVNGRIEVWWQGRDATDTAVDNIRSAYSDDGGVTWTVRTKITSGNTKTQSNVTVTANKKNEIFAVWMAVSPTSNKWYLRKVKVSGSNAVGSITNITDTESDTLYPSTLYDSNFNFSEPLFICKDATNAKVGFYGTWTMSSISPAQGDRGIITNRQSIMTYAITSEGPVGVVTEKINGVTVGTKTLTSGQNTTISITQAQWDNIKYGKYKDINANRNTITIEAQGNIYTYTFDKEPTSASDIISQAKAVKDSAEVSMPAKKKILSDAINANGGTSTASESLESLSSKVRGISDNNYKTGMSISSSSTKSFAGMNNGAVSNLYYVTLDTSNLGFSPSTVVLYATAKNSSNLFYWTDINFVDQSSTYYGNCGFGSDAYRSQINGTTLEIPVSTSSLSYTWRAYK